MDANSATANVIRMTHAAAPRLAPVTKFIMTPSLIVGPRFAQSFCGAAKRTDSILSKTGASFGGRKSFRISRSARRSCMKLSVHSDAPVLTWRPQPQNLPGVKLKGWLQLAASERLHRVLPTNTGGERA